MNTNFIEFPEEMKNKNEKKNKKQKPLTQFIALWIGTIDSYDLFIR